ncbi:MAG: GNAT family N-acetyltransferase [Thermoprotei archaeon]
MLCLAFKGSREEYLKLIEMLNIINPRHKIPIESLDSFIQEDLIAMKRMGLRRFKLIGDNDTLVGFLETSLWPFGSSESNSYKVSFIIPSDFWRLDVLKFSLNCITSILPSTKNIHLYTILDSSVNEKLIKELKNLGFTYTWSFLEMEHDLSVQISGEEVSTLLKRLETKGIEIKSLGEVEEHRYLEIISSIYQLEDETIKDAPHIIRSLTETLDLESYSKLFKDNIDKVCSFIAFKDDKIVGVSYNVRVADKLKTVFTGVLREYRGFGIAKALKLKTIERAKIEKLKSIIAFNDSINAPIIMLNTKLGFKVVTEWYVLIREGVKTTEI